MLLNVFCMMGSDPKSGGGSMSSLLLLVGMIVVLYFFMIRPQAKRAKKQKAFVNSLQKGHKIVTLSGIHGKISKLNEDNTVDLEVSPGNYIKMERNSISMELSEPLNRVLVNATDKK